MFPAFFKVNCIPTCRIIYRTILSLCKQESLPYSRMIRSNDLDWIINCITFYIKCCGCIISNSTPSSNTNAFLKKSWNFLFIFKQYCFSFIRICKLILYCLMQNTYSLFSIVYYPSIITNLL